MQNIHHFEVTQNINNPKHVKHLILLDIYQLIFHLNVNSLYFLGKSHACQMVFVQHVNPAFLHLYVLFIQPFLQEHNDEGP